MKCKNLCKRQNRIIYSSVFFSYQLGNAFITTFRHNYVKVKRNMAYFRMNPATFNYEWEPSVELQYPQKNDLL